MDVPELMLCEHCWHPISADGEFVVRGIRDEAHPLLATSFSYTHPDGDPACQAARPSRVRVVHERPASPVVVDPPAEEEPGAGGPAG
ncbi:hypothetical protein MUY14_08205 [Amycolatopsis sp. FBCC-B4732]|uniref:hypothetical protein n=1 Tax=Amycolatopsis sp. FBCC-B4732 TaxID=3079339 RepID=UPI001FF59D39|nr:hypothetical protein [Amycolatopsis sp. FBCC-B4732]UOX90594.1 hypothetical protein MUY14_08205 [Amycolatopsis sp. FBCC-B4732]